MKVQIKVTVEVDVGSWIENYGPMTASEVRSDVRDSAENYLYTHPSEAITPAG